MSPTKIQINDSNLLINWDDGVLTEIPLKELRRNCPCAFCKKEKEEQSTTYIPLYSNFQVAVSEIKLVGSYAVGVKWKDGHNTGIFEYSNLKQLGNNKQA